VTWRPGKNFRVGAMRHRIHVQSLVATRDSTGQAVPTWNDRLKNEPAAYSFTGGGTAYRGSQLAENIVAVFVVRFRDGYDSTQRIVFGGQIFGITLVKPVDGGRRYLELMCKAVAA